MSLKRKRKGSTEPSSSDDTIKLFIQCWHGRTYPLRVKLSSHVENVKYQIQEKEGTYIQNQIFKFQGEELDDNNTLEYYNIVNESTIKFSATYTAKCGETAGHHVSNYISSVSPHSEQENVALDVVIKVTFSMFVKDVPESALGIKVVDNSTPHLRDKSIGGNVNYDKDTGTATFTPYQRIKPNMKVCVTVYGDKVVRITDGCCKGNCDWYFYTRKFIKLNLYFNLVGTTTTKQGSVQLNEHGGIAQLVKCISRLYQTPEHNIVALSFMKGDKHELLAHNDVLQLPDNSTISFSVKLPITDLLTNEPFPENTIPEPPAPKDLPNKNSVVKLYNPLNATSVNNARMTDEPPTPSIISSHSTASSLITNQAHSKNRNNNQVANYDLIDNPKDIQRDRIIGYGTISEVWMGKCGGETVAIKELKLREGGLLNTEDFVSELNVIGKLRHPNIVEFKAVHIPKKGPPLLVSELMQKGSLHHIIHDQQDELTPKERIEIALDVAQAMAFLHKSGVVHNSLKSKNILLSHSSKAKLSDFGLSKTKEAILKSTDLVDFHPAWIAPECLRGEPISKEANVYSFGVILWELMTGNIPWAEIQPFQIPIAVAVGEKRLPAPKDWPIALLHLLDKCLDGIPANRPVFADIVKDLTAMHLPNQQNSLPYAFFCPISGKLMKDPVICTDGYTYDSESITQWLRKSNISPITKLPLTSTSLLPNHTLRYAIEGNTP